MEKETSIEHFPFLVSVEYDQDDVVGAIVPSEVISILKKSLYSDIYDIKISKGYQQGIIYLTKKTR